jgi:hypothetical protein
VLYRRVNVLKDSLAVETFRQIDAGLDPSPLGSNPSDWDHRIRLLTPPLFTAN